MKETAHWKEKEKEEGRGNRGKQETGEAGRQVGENASRKSCSIFLERILTICCICSILLEDMVPGHFRHGPASTTAWTWMISMSKASL